MTRSKRRLFAVLATVVVTIATTMSGAEGLPMVRGIDGKTIKVAGIGIKGQLPETPIGAQARFKRANRDDELGYKIKFAEFADDGQDPAKTLSEVRRLVTQEQVFALVAVTSATLPGEFLNQQHVPYFGWAFDTSYCSPTPTDELYGFGYNGCLVPNKPKRMPDSARNQYKYVSEKTGKKHPTAALISGDTRAGHDAARFQASAYQGRGFDVVYAKGVVPLPPVSDYTPYVQDVLTAEDGDPPDAIVCLAAADCLPIYQQVKQSGYEGTFLSAVYHPAVVGAMEGAVIGNGFQVFNATGVPALERMKADIKAFKPGTSLTSGVAAGYFTADFFIKALKKVGKNPTPEKVQRAAAHMTFQIKGLVGPTEYPASTTKSTPTCSALVKSDGTTFEIVAPFACSSKSFPVLKKFKG